MSSSSNIQRHCSRFIIHFFPILACLFVLSAPVFAEVRGEIINISQQYKVAFIDIGNEALAVGTIVEIQGNADTPIYLQVIEADTGLSKLGFVNSGEYKTDAANFEKIIVGNTVTIVSQNVQNAEAPAAAQKVESSQKYGQLATELQDKERQVTELTKNLEDLQILNKSLKQENSRLLLEKHINDQEKVQRYQEMGRLKDTINQLKERLQNIQKLIHEGNTCP